METKFYQQREYDCPNGGGYGIYEAGTRWRLIAEGIANVLRYVPHEERALVTNLQYAFMQAEQMRRALAEPVEQEKFTWPT
jgi:hypothetical protein